MRLPFRSIRKVGATPTGIRTAIVTGASRGIGAAVARHLAATGYAVIVNYHTGTNEAETLREQIAAEGGHVRTFGADITRESEARALVDFAVEQFGPLDVLVNNAGISPSRCLADIDGAHIDEVFAVNVRGVLLASKHAARSFGSEGGAIVNISSIYGASPVSGFSAYSATKAAVNAITVSLARELGPSHIRVNAVAPGLIETERCLRDVPLDVRRRVAAETPLRRSGTPGDVAALVAYLASDEARWVTGQIITASGGSV